MKETIEKLARAVCDARALPGTKPVAKLSDVDRRVARAVLMAFRDAEDLAALIAGKKSLYSCSEDPDLADARKCLHAMIDAVLE